MYEDVSKFKILPYLYKMLNFLLKAVLGGREKTLIRTTAVHGQNANIKNLDAYKFVEKKYEPLLFGGTINAYTFLIILY
jgi:hypothetical protein